MKHKENATPNISEALRQTKKPQAQEGMGSSVADQKSSQPPVVKKRKGIKQSPETIEKRVSQYRGINHWTRRMPVAESTKIKISIKLMGRKLPKEVVDKMRLSANRGSDNYRWLAHPTNYGTIHNRITRDFGRPMKCESCLSTKKKKYEWANIDGRYKLDRADWKRLCTSCHRQMDYDRLRSAGYKKDGRHGKWVKHL
jgi:hypothetical protein